MHSQLMQDLAQFWVPKTMEFFAAVITNLDRGTEAFIGAEGLDVLLCVHSSIPEIFSNFREAGVWDGEMASDRTVWGGAIRVLFQDAEAAQHRLVTVIGDSDSTRPKPKPRAHPVGVLVYFRLSLRLTILQQFLRCYSVGVLGSNGKPSENTCRSLLQP